MNNLSENKPKLRIVFMGTPEFAVPSLKILIENNYNVVAVVTAPDKPAGRGMQMHESAVKKIAGENNLYLLQPEKLKSPEFAEQLQALKPDLQIVVAFRMLPEVIWKMPRIGTFNLHASLLPKYRGAAPINWAVINGEKETGATTFFLEHEIDTGKIILQQKVNITEEETAGELHDELMNAGAELVLKTVHLIDEGNYSLTPQIFSAEIKSAPKLFTETCLVNWNNSVQQIHNLIRGLSPYPAAFTKLNGKTVKIFRSKKLSIDHYPLSINNSPGNISTDGKSFLRIQCADGLLEILELQLEGKKKIKTEEFLRGYRFDEKNMKCESF